MTGGGGGDDDDVDDETFRGWHLFAADATSSVVH